MILVRSGQVEINLKWVLNGFVEVLLGFGQV